MEVEGSIPSVPNRQGEVGRGKAGVEGSTPLLPTLQRILTSDRKKVAETLIKGKAIKIKNIGLTRLV